ncbi:hypothetical protein SLEP1_g21644 [Rubroshorea leprosula]|uniref:Uncharacterized protein n=1 Tax=Rubroshorea leprosula TaxID=152421 RepID=A0AAV5JC03_9ROSI|nr:hypothetical protein SLEP1_g21644 [Rubroshorea leprosula]
MKNESARQGPAISSSSKHEQCSSSVHHKQGCLPFAASPFFKF